MIEKFCTYLTRKIGKEMPELTEERLEIINYGLENIIGEMPKILITIIVAFLFGIGDLTLWSLLVIAPYRCFSGGFHAKTHLGCIFCTTLMFCGTAFLAKNIYLSSHELKYIVISLVWLFSIIMIKLYAPADTEELPILRKKDRKQKQILSYITVTIELIISTIIPNMMISKLIIFGMLFQTLTITKLVYKFANIGTLVKIFYTR